MREGGGKSEKGDRQSKGSEGIVKDRREGWSFQLWRKGQGFFFKDERESNRRRCILNLKLQDFSLQGALRSERIRWV